MTILNFTNQVTRILENNKIQYAVVGGCAKLIYHKNVSTSDLDILIDNSTNNITRFLHFMEKHFKTKITLSKIRNYDVVKVKATPYSLDFHFNLDGVSNKNIFEHLHLHLIEHNPVQFISEKNLLKNLNKVANKNGIH
ncbi:hypothetical protein [Ferruginibacter sp. SUN106]|uniref:hypothetical protein n=1 Tax=Ferruginibacter sp. SUN106 TaxID=2978348 RepID=UPI003D366560